MMLPLKKSRCKIPLLVSLLMFAIAHAFAQKVDLDSLNTFIVRLMKDFEVPGLAIGIIEKDSVLLSKGYGALKINERLPVDGNSMFGIGSISKSFTALTLGILVGEGRLQWDDPVKKYLPYFELYDPYVTKNFTIRDLLIHRSGLGWVSGGTLWYHSDLSRIDIIKKLKYLEPVSGFRNKPAYQNVMYVVAGEVVREVSGMSWDKFLETSVLRPLKMGNSTSVSAVRESSSNVALPHITGNLGQKVAIVQEKGNNLAAGGFIYSSVNDMLKYMQMLLNDGVFHKDTIIDHGALKEIFRPQIHFPFYGSRFHNEFTSYGFGWWLTPKNGHKIIEHGGAIDGMSANLVMLDDLDFGIVVLSNTNESAAFVLTSKVLQYMTNDDSYDIYASWKLGRDKYQEERNTRAFLLGKTRSMGSKPSLGLGKYAGTYVDKMYGEIIITMTSDRKLEISFTHTPLFHGILTHWHFDTFRIDWTDIRVPDGLLTFNFNGKREIVGIRLDQPDLLDVNFGELDIIKVED